MVNVTAINKERLDRWRNLCNRKQSTAIVLIAVGHDHNEGQITVFTTDKRTDQELLLFLEHAVNELKNKIAS